MIIAPPDNGRVLAFVLPTLVHILAQPPVQPEEGPVLGPTALPAPPPLGGSRVREWMGATGPAPWASLSCLVWSLVQLHARDIFF